MAKVMYSVAHQKFICIYTKQETGRCTIDTFESKKDADEFKEKQEQLEKDPLFWYMKEA